MGGNAIKKVRSTSSENFCDESCSINISYEGFEVLTEGNVEI
jgi:hypothetical protein